MHGADRSLRLHGESDHVPRARRFVAEMLAGTPGQAAVGDAQLVVTELATNALLHAGGPVEVRVGMSGADVRVEVSDGSRVLPMRAPTGVDAMTGRGLRLVEALSNRFGVELGPGGKVVWAEVAVDAHRPAAAGDGKSMAAEETERAAVDALLEAWAEPDLTAPPRRYTVSLGDVPTDLLLAAKTHVDNLIREFSLAAAGAASRRSAAIPGDLARLIETVTSRFAEARQAIKRQALAADAAGLPRTRLELTLPLSAADAGEDYLAALDEADAYARAARLLTLETPAQHRAFRRWYVESLVDQLRRAAKGDAPARPATFEQYLLDEYVTVTTAHRVADRAARLQLVTASLAGATSPDQVAAVVVSEGVKALSAAGGSLLIPLDDDHLAVPGAVGYPKELIAELRAERLDAELPAAVALRTREPVWLESPQQRDERFPRLLGFEPRTVSMCAVPLIAGDRVLGALRFSFDTPRLFDDDERRFVLALAAQTAQALERSELYAGEREARATAEMVAARLARLQHVIAALAAARELDEVADIVVTEAADALGATLAALCVLTDDEASLEIVRIRGGRPGVEEQWRVFPVAADVPVSEAVRTGQPVIVSGRAEIDRRFPTLAGASTADRSLVCVPLAVGGRRLGALALRFPPDHAIDEPEIQLFVSIAGQCAVALERARLFAAERAAHQRSAFLAEATELLTSSLEPTETVEHLTSLLVPALADWAVVYLTDASGRARPTAIAHRDQLVAARVRPLFESRPLAAESAGGVAEVLRTGRSVRYARVPDAIRARALGDIPDEDLVRAVDPRTGLCVALVARGSVLGAVAIARVAGPAYTDDDLRLVEDVAARAAVAVSHAQQFGQERDSALTLQRSLLPQRLPRVPGVSFAWRYLPGTAGTHIGGDWYDVIPLEQGSVALVIGDVMGRGLQAAAVMGQLRATARAYASVRMGPAEVLTQLDRAVGGLEQAQITTAAFGTLDPATRSLTLASAGHLPPLVITRDGRADYLDVEPGPPLGAGGADYPELTVTLPAGATLLLFTDGLIEDRRTSVDEGMQALRQAVSAADGPEQLCRRALTALGRDNTHDDDVAVLAVALTGG